MMVHRLHKIVKHVILDFVLGHGHMFGRLHKLNVKYLCIVTC